MGRKKGFSNECVNRRLHYKVEQVVRVNGKSGEKNGKHCGEYKVAEEKDQIRERRHEKSGRTVRAIVQQRRKDKEEHLPREEVAALKPQFNAPFVPFSLLSG